MLNLGVLLGLNLMLKGLVAAVAWRTFSNSISHALVLPIPKSGGPAHDISHRYHLLLGLL